MLSGIILASGRSWKQQRRFGIMTLRSLGMGKKGLEYRVQEEASHLVEFFVSLKGISAKKLDAFQFLDPNLQYVSLPTSF